MMRASAAQSSAVLQVSDVVVLTRATVPAVADMAMLPLASGVGSGVVPPAPWASPMRYRPPAGTAPERLVTCHWLVGDGLAGRYWTLQPATDAASLPALASSMKSRVKVAPELPPPPYTSAIMGPAEGTAIMVRIPARRPKTAAARPTTRSRRCIGAPVLNWRCLAGCRY